MTNNVKTLGQVFTPEQYVKDILSLRRNNGTVLEPSCGNGSISNLLPGCVAIELDKKVAPAYALIQDFFTYPISNKFDSVIGNPPFVKYKDIYPGTKNLIEKDVLFNKRSNLYLHFIKKSIQHLNPNGELIFINPKEFLNAESSRLLNEWMYKQGTITDYIDYGDEIIFQGFSPNCVVFRFEKDNFTRRTRIIKSFSNFNNINNQFIFSNKNLTVSLSDILEVKVGAVSGSDKIFTSPEGNKTFVYSETNKTKKLKTMFYNIESPKLQIHKKELLKRKMKKFNEDNWFEWGRSMVEVSTRPRIYVNQKTRNPSPFFINDCTYYDGSVLGLFIKNKNVNIFDLCNDLNKLDWEELNFKTGDRFIFHTSALNCMKLPSYFEKYIM